MRKDCLTLENKDQVKKNGSVGKIVRWILGILFIIFAFGSGFHFSSLLLLLAAVLILPLSFIEKLLKKINVSKTIAIILSVVLFFGGILSSPSTETVDENAVETPIAETIEDMVDETTIEETIEAVIEETTVEETTEAVIEETTVEETTEAVIEETTVEDTTEADIEETTQNNTDMVWITETGKKYHRIPDCGRTKNAWQVTLEEALAMELGPCSNCH
jgi:hypothetical protein